MGPTILFAEQNMHFPTEISDRAYVIEKCHIRYQGTMGELVANEEGKAKYPDDLRPPYGIWILPPSPPFYPFITFA